MKQKEGMKRLKTFNIDEEIYREFSEYCRKHGISMSKKIENFIREELESIKRLMKNIHLRSIVESYYFSKSHFQTGINFIVPSSNLIFSSCFLVSIIPSFLLNLFINSLIGLKSSELIFS